jgi:hypothetical protein
MAQQHKIDGGMALLSADSDVIEGDWVPQLPSPSPVRKETIDRMRLGQSPPRGCELMSCTANDQNAPAVFEYDARQHRVSMIFQAVRAMDAARMTRAACHSALDNSAPPPRLQRLDGDGDADDRCQPSSSPTTERQLRALCFEATDCCARWRMCALEAEAQSLNEFAPYSAEARLLAIDSAAQSARLRRSVTDAEAEFLVSKTDLTISMAVALQAMHRGRATRSLKAKTDLARCRAAWRKLGISRPSGREHCDGYGVGRWPSRSRSDPPRVASALGSIAMCVPSCEGDGAALHDSDAQDDDEGELGLGVVTFLNVKVVDRKVDGFSRTASHAGCTAALLGDSAFCIAAASRGAYESPNWTDDGESDDDDNDAPLAKLVLEGTLFELAHQVRTVG